MLRKLLAPCLAVAALALPSAPSQAVSSLTYTFVVNCAQPTATYSLVDMPTGNYAVTVTGACSNDGEKSKPVGTTTCGLHGVPTHPCVPTPPVNNAPSEVCSISAGGAYYHTCENRGLWIPLCNWWYTVLVDGKCVSAQHNAGIVFHDNNGPMTARYFDGSYGDNVGAFVVTATWLAA